MAPDSEAKIRIGVLCLLYSKRRANPDFAALSLLDMENIALSAKELRSRYRSILAVRATSRRTSRAALCHCCAESVDFLWCQFAPELDPVQDIPRLRCGA